LELLRDIEHCLACQVWHAWGAFPIPGDRRNTFWVYN